MRRPRWQPQRNQFYRCRDRRRNHPPGRKSVGVYDLRLRPGQSGGLQDGILVAADVAYITAVNTAAKTSGLTLNSGIPASPAATSEHCVVSRCRPPRKVISSHLSAQLSAPSTGRRQLRADRSATFGGGNIQLQILSFDKVTWLNVGAANHRQRLRQLSLPPGQYRMAITTATAVYAALTSVPT